MMRMRSWKRTERYLISYLPRQIQRGPRRDLSLQPAFRGQASESACHSTIGTRTHSGTGSGGESGQDGSDEQSGTHLEYNSTMERRMRLIVT
jgi:hypothetical protein